MPILPPPSRYLFDATNAAPGEDLIGVGADLAPGTILEAYTRGLFPMGLGRGGTPPLGWWSPDPRGVLRLGDVHVSRSLRRSMRRFEVCVDTDFAGVVAGCADPRRSGRWITREVATAYAELHELGWAHSVEIKRNGVLVGGLYGLAIGGLFAGESMFHRATDASKAAVVVLHDLLNSDGDPRRLIDVQWLTPHLATLGVTEVPRRDYLRLLGDALTAPLPTAFQ
jgi:leucyl/phenylalanyl-tRNA---protein transferase